MGEEKSDYIYIFVSAGLPQMYSHPIDGYGNPPEFIKQPLGWVSEKEGFGVRLFKYSRKVLYRDTGKEVLVYEETIPNPTLCYRALDYSYNNDDVWETPTTRNAKAALVTSPVSEN